MENEVGELATAAADLAAAATDRQDLGSRAGRLADRLAHRHFNVAVLGEFKRGKSTLVNALLGLDLMPTGALPLTAVATEIAYGLLGATVVHWDGSTEEIELANVADYVTEARNPGNERQVAHVDVRAPVELLRPGVVLVDTPGIGSVFRHDETATRALLESDGAIVVMSAEAPLSEEERKLLAALSERRAPTFFVLNRVDHLTPAEREEVARFVTEAIASELGHKERLWCVSARGALIARLAGRVPDDDAAGEFAAFFQAFTRFVELDLVRARVETARAEVSRLAHELDDSLAIEAVAAELDAASLAERVTRLRDAAAEQRQAFEDERTLLQRDVATLAGTIALALADFASRAPSRFDGKLDEIARVAPLAQLQAALQRIVETTVRESFEHFRQGEAERAEGSWRWLAERFRDHTQDRVNAVRAAAADIFQIELPDLVIPQVAEERERYYYLFLHVGSSTDGIERMAWWLMPPRLRRRRLLERARRDLAAEFDKHAGRARWDLTQRLDTVRRRFEVAMGVELEGSVQAILGATARAEQLRSLAGADRQRHLRSREAALRATSAALALSDQA